MLPFFGILMYVKKFYEDFSVYNEKIETIFAHAIFLYLLIFIRELIKDIENLQGDLVVNHKTIPVMFGERVAKNVIMVPTAEYELSGFFGHVVFNGHIVEPDGDNLTVYYGASDEFVCGAKFCITEIFSLLK